MIYTNDPFGPVGIVIPSGMLARYVEFEESMQELHVPEGSARVRVRGVEAICMGVNSAISKTLWNNVTRGLYTHYWFIDDDHEFHPRHLINLLTRNVDIIQGPAISKMPPWRLSIFKDCKSDSNEFVPYTFADLAGKTGLLEVHACGRGGLLVHRRVFEKMTPPWFQMGQLNPEVHNEDVHFCERAKTLGFKVYADLDNPTGHTGNVVYYPHQKKDGTWSARVMFANNQGFVLRDEQ